MNVHIFESEEQVSKAGALLFAAQLIDDPESVIGLATGSTPLGLYAELVRLYQEGIISFQEATTFNLDEYVGLDSEHQESYHYFMQENLFSFIDIDDDRIHVPDGMAVDPESEAIWYEDMIDEAGGIDIQLLGIGVNGHIGFNEPSNIFSQATHAVELTESTIEANARFFNDKSEVPRQALTMGIGTIMGAMKIVMVAFGKSKAEAIKAMIDGPIDPACPASILQLHDDVTVLLDQEAASLLLD